MKPDKAPSNSAQPPKWWRWKDASPRKGLPEDYRPTSQKQRRRWVVTFVAGCLTLILGLALSDLIGHLFEYSWLIVLVWVAASMSGLIALVVGLINLSQDKLIMQTARRPLKDLDERQRQVRLRASELAYNSVMTVAFAVLFAFQFTPDSFQVLLGEALTKGFTFPILGALFLKACIIAWLEPDPIPDDSVPFGQVA